MTLTTNKYSRPFFSRETCPECLPFFGSSVMHRWVPVLDIFEKEDKLILKMELPGVDPENIEVNIDDQVLTIKGKRDREEESDNHNYHRSERWHGEFSRSFSLPQWADTTEIAADYNEGVLHVSLPRKEEEKRKSFKVNIK